MRICDIHVHMWPVEMMHPWCLELMSSRRPDWEDILALTRDPRLFVERMDQDGISVVGVINYVAPEVIGFTEGVNEWAANYVRDYRDRLLPFGSLDPRTCLDPADEMDRLIHDLKLAALKLHPPHTLFYPNAYLDGMEALRVVYEKAQDAHLPIMIHTGTSVFRGARNKYAHPMYVDDVAVDFPELTLILAHGGRPLWMDEAAFLARRHPNVHIDISSFPPANLPRYFPDVERLAHKMLWGSDWPGPLVKGMGANLEKFMDLPLSEDARRRILWDNAARLFDLS